MAKNESDINLIHLLNLKLCHYKFNRKKNLVVINRFKITEGQ